MAGEHPPSENGDQAGSQIFRYYTVFKGKFNVFPKGRPLFHLRFTITHNMRQEFFPFHLHSSAASDAEQPACRSLYSNLAGGLERCDHFSQYFHCRSYGSEKIML
ncbi:hypothetical protein VU07_03445 [Desulfobulbus sp. F4]|nr:hypothetical protein [Desulfobulbus sp. F4]